MDTCTHGAVAVRNGPVRLIDGRRGDAEHIGKPRRPSRHRTATPCRRSTTQSRWNRYQRAWLAPIELEDETVEEDPETMPQDQDEGEDVSETRDEDVPDTMNDDAPPESSNQAVPDPPTVCLPMDVDTSNAAEPQNHNHNAVPVSCGTSAESAALDARMMPPPPPRSILTIRTNERVVPVSIGKRSVASAWGIQYG